MRDDKAPTQDGQALSFGQRLRHYRMQAGLTQEELAERAGLSVRGISDLERDIRRAPYPDTTNRLATALGLGDHERAELQRARSHVRQTHGEQPHAQPTPALPTGTVTFLFTDVEGSTRAWERQPDAVRLALARHDAIIEHVVAQHGGVVVRPRGEGDSRFVVFSRASDAVTGACAIQRALFHEPWPTAEPLRVRLALHTGEADLRDGDYYGSAVNRCARLRGIARGGQLLLSGVTADLVRDALPTDTRLRDLGLHRLRDLDTPERVWQLTHPDLQADFPPLDSLDVRHTNLPIQLTSFVGRQRELAEIKRHVAASRLVTLTGVGGAGKTRLAFQVAADLVGEYPDGSWVVELASLQDAALVARAVAAALGIREQPGVALDTVIADVLHARQLLLVLDNCEHLVEVAAQLVDALLRRCPALHILATSREKLGVGGEVVWIVPPLGLPDLAVFPSADKLIESEAVRLFVERCEAIQPEFALTAQNARGVLDVCLGVDGNPLALELAAARVRVLGVEQIAARLTDQLKLLTGGSRTAERRQQTLRAAVEWSYELLSDEERLLFNRTSVFAGGFSLEAVQEICAGDGVDPADTLDLVQQLVDKSLVVTARVADGGVGRFRVLEILRQYGQEQLRASGAFDSISARHAAFFAGLVEELGADCHGPGRTEYMHRLEQEHDNIRRALQWVVEQQDSAVALRFARMEWFWMERDLWSEGRAWAERILGLSIEPEDVKARAELLLLSGEAAWLVGDMEVAYRQAEQALALSRQSADRQLEGAATGFLGLLLWIKGQLADAWPLIEKALALSQQAGDRWTQSRMLEQLGIMRLQEHDNVTAKMHIQESVRLAREFNDAYSLCIALNFLGDVAAIQGATDEAEAAYTESLDISDALGHPTPGTTALHSLGFLAVSRGDFARAGSLFVDCLARVRRRGGKRGVAECLIGFAGIARAGSQDQLAVELLGAAEATLESIGASVWTTYRPFYDREVAAGTARLGEAEFNRNWAIGRALPLERAIALAYAVADSCVVARG
jgi:predicted ATPase/class 3 adenylate cyclase